MQTLPGESACAACVIFFRAMVDRKQKVKKRAASKRSKAPIGTTAKKPAKAAKVAKTVGAGTNPKRVAAILAQVDQACPGAACGLKAEEPFQLLKLTTL